MRKQRFSVALVLFMLISILPFTAYAGDGDQKGNDICITRVDLTVPVPKVGDVFNGVEDDAGAQPVGSGVHYVVKQSKWYNEWGLSDRNMVFEAGSKYFVEIDLSADSGYRFDENTVATINGQPAKVFRQSNVTTWYACSENLTPEAAETPFTDVSKDAYYAQPVLWAVNHDPQITNGVGGGRFAPDSTCTRGQIVTFLWRAMGEPEPTSTSCPFTDVHPSDYYYKAVLWAVENNITNGTGPNTFSPDAGCTRGQVVTFLWRAEKSSTSSASPFEATVYVTKSGTKYHYAGCKHIKNRTTTALSLSVAQARGYTACADCANGAPGSNPNPNPNPGGQTPVPVRQTVGGFLDVFADEYYADAVLWAVEQQITNGVGNGLFAPNSTCTRGQIVTFLYRDMA